MADMRFFSNTEPVAYWGGMRNAEFAARFPGAKAKRFDGFSMLVGKNTAGQLVPITRSIVFKSRPSLHKCGPKCRDAKGPNCECSCGGQFHGAGG